MARIRTVKPDLWQDEAIADISEGERLLFIGLITQADDEGRLKGDPRLVRSLIFPYDEISLPEVSGRLRNLSEVGLIHWFTVDGRQFIELPSWSKHQRVSHPTKSALPSHSEADSTDAPQALQKVPEEPRREGKGREGIKETALSADKPPTDARKVFDAWVEATGKNPKQVKFSNDRRSLIARQLKLYPVEDLIDAVRGWRHSPHHRGENDRGTVYNDLKLLLRDSDKIEGFRDLERRANGQRPAAQPMASPMSRVAEP